MSSVQPSVDAAGRRRSPATMPAFHAGKVPRNKGQRYPADPPTVDEIVAVMRREVDMDGWERSALQPWLVERATLPVGPLVCVVVGPSRGHRWSESAARLELLRTAIRAGVRRRIAPQLRHAHAVELLHEGIALPLIQRQRGHSHLSTAGTCLRRSPLKRSSRLSTLGGLR